MNYSLPGSSVHGILQAKTLEWIAIPLSRGSSQPRDRTRVSCIAGRFFASWATREAPRTYPVQFSSVQSLSHVQLFATPLVTARQASLSITNSQSSLRLTSIQSVILSSNIILYRPLPLLPPIPPSIRVFSNESTLQRTLQSHPGHVFGENSSSISYMHPNVHCSTIYNSQDSQAT